MVYSKENFNLFFTKQYYCIVVGRNTGNNSGNQKVLVTNNPHVIFRNKYFLFVELES